MTEALRFILGNPLHLVGAAILLLCFRPLRITIKGRDHDD